MIYLNRKSTTISIFSSYQYSIERTMYYLGKALLTLEQAKQRLANEKKQNGKKRKAENHHKYIMGGIIVKHFPDCYCYDEDISYRLPYRQGMSADYI